MSNRLSSSQFSFEGGIDELFGVRPLTEKQRIRRCNNHQNYELSFRAQHSHLWRSGAKNPEAAWILDSSWSLS